MNLRHVVNISPMLQALELMANLPVYSPRDLQQGAFGATLYPWFLDEIHIAQYSMMKPKMDSSYSFKDPRSVCPAITNLTKL